MKFKSRVCKSFFWTDANETGITFEDCVVGGTYYKDFTIWNRSEIDLYWILNIFDLANKNTRNILIFSDYDSGEPFDASPIHAYSPKRIRITFKPTEVGEFNYDLQLENINDSENTISCHVFALVRSVLQEESLVLSSGSMIDFGDCCAGVQARHRLVLRNVSDSILDISLGSDCPFIEFQLKADRSTQNIQSTTSFRNLFDKPKIPVVDTSFEHSPPSSAGSRSSSPIQSNRISALDLTEEDHGTPLSCASSTGDIIDDFGEDIQHEENIYDDTQNEDISRIEELQLRPGAEKSLEVCYKPEIEPVDVDYRAGHLSRRTFKLFLDSSNSASMKSEKKSIQCKARVCTSFISVFPKELDFGDTDVGLLKVLPIKITNCSELEAKIELQYVSKVLNACRDVMIIPPKQSIDMKIELYPRKVNPGFIF